MKESYKKQRDSIPISSIPWDSSWPRLLDESEEEALLGYLDERFGIPPEVFEDYFWFKREKTWWMVRASRLIEKASTLKISLVGLRAFTKIGEFIKPTTRMIQVFGKHAVKSRLEVGKNDLRRLLAGETLPIESRQENGYVILSHGGDIIGLGLLLNNLVRSQLPRQYKKLLEPFLKPIP
jgi:NOL1/NOP2/fmu family ribosome biogenesis protein